MNIDKSDGAQVFVKRATGLSTEFITAKSSEVNVCLVEDNGEYVSNSGIFYDPRVLEFIFG